MPNNCPCSTPCPIKSILEVIGGKWKLQIICALKSDGLMRYSALSKKIAGITNTMLSSSLKELERDGLIVRIQHNTMPICVEYETTAKVDSLVPILMELGKWYNANIKSN